MSDVDYSIGLDASGYTQGVQQVATATTQLSSAMAQVTNQSHLAAKGLAMLAPLGAVGALGRFAKTAADTEQAMAGIRATAVASGASIRGLAHETDQLARKFPIGNAGARAMVTQLQSLGVTGRGSERHLGQLATTLTKFQAATGGSAEGLVQLSRAFGNRDLNSGKISALADSMTTLQGRIGGSADQMAVFARQISPFARQAGLSASATLGIAGAFSKLGDDSGQAATAFSKMLADMNRSVRDGGPQMAQYASIVGKTTDQFRELFKQNPAEALAQVTEALGRPGAEPQRQLEALGFDGVRTARALTSLSQSGGLRDAISTSVGAYGSGSTAEASKEALHGFNESLIRLQSSSEQFATALGTPVLGPLTSFGNMLGKITGMFASVASSKPMQMLMGATAPLAVGAGLVGSAYGLARMDTVRRAGWRSSVMQGLRAGMAEARYGGLDEAEAAFEEQLGTKRRGSFGYQTTQRRLEDVRMQRQRMHLSDDDLGGLDKFSMRMQGLGSAVRQRGGGGGGLMNQAMGWLGIGTSAYFDLGQGDFARRAGRPLNTMSQQIPYPNNMRQAIADRAKELQKKDENGEGGLSRFKAWGQALNEMHGAMKEVPVAARSASFGLRSFAISLGRTAAVAGGTIARLGKGIAANPMIALSIAGSVAGWALNRRRQHQEEEKQSIEDFKGQSLTSVMDRYNESLGRASQNTMTMADVMASAAKKISNSATSFSQATNVSADDIVAATTGEAKNKFGGNKQQIAAQLDLMGTSGMDPAQLQQIKLDLLRSGVKPEDVQSLLSSRGTGARQFSSSETAGIFKDGKLTGKDEIKTAVELATNGVAAEYARNSDKYGEEYAVGVRNRQMLEIERASLQNGDAQDQLSKRFGAFKGYNEFKTKWGGATATTDETGAVYMPWETPDALTTPLARGGSTLGGLQNGRTHVSTSGVIGQAFDLRNNSTLAQTVRGVQPGDPASINTAVEALLKGARDAGQSMADFADEATKSASNMAEGVEREIVQMAAARARQRAQVQAPSAGFALGQGYASDLNIANNMVPTNDDDAATLEGARQGIIDKEGQMKSLYAGWLRAQWEFNKSSGRAWEDYNLNATRAWDNYERSVSRAQEDAQTQRLHTLRDFAKSLRRAAEDAAKSYYDPFQRANIEMVWDARSLLQNLQDQTARISGQVANLNKARQMGLSGQVIEQLQLGESSHAQELQLLLDNAVGDPSVVKALNAAAQKRADASTDLYSDQSNKANVRAKEDLNQSFKDQDTAMALSFRRGREDTARELANSRKDMKTALGRTAQDLKDSQLEMTNSFETLQAAMMDLASGKVVDFAKLMSNQFESIVQGIKSGGLSVTDAIIEAANAEGRGSGGSGGGSSSVGGTQRRNNPDFGGGSGGAGSQYGTAQSFIGSFKNPYEGAKKVPNNVVLGRRLASSYGWSGGDEWNALFWLWQQESGWKTNAGRLSAAYGIPQSHPGHKMASEGRDWKTNPETQIRWGLKYIRQTYGSPMGAVQHKMDTDTRRGADPKIKYNQKGGWYGDGGLFMATRGPQHIGVGERGPEAVIPLNERGVGVLSEAMRRATSGNLETRIARTHIVYDNSKHTYDHSMTISGPVTLEADDPRRMLEELRAIKAKANLTKAGPRKSA